MNHLPSPIAVTVTQDGIAAFHASFGGSNPIHTDHDAASESEFGAPIQHGMRTLYPAYAALAGAAGDALFDGGRLSAKFVGPVVAGDVVTTTLSRAAAGDPETDPGIRIEARKSDGQLVLVGVAQLAGK